MNNDFMFILSHMLAQDVSVTMSFRTLCLILRSVKFGTTFQPFISDRIDFAIQSAITDAMAKTLTRSGSFIDPPSFTGSPQATATSGRFTLSAAFMVFV